MNRLLLMVALILAASSSVFGQSISSSTVNLRQNSVQVDSIPLSDKLDVEKSPVVKSSSKAGAHHRVPDAVSDTDESQGRFWGSAVYLLWKMKKSNLPPLITTGPASGDAIIGQPGTVIAFGGNKLDRGKFPGGRFTVGVWLNEKKSVGVELSYFFLKERTFNFQVSSSGLPGSLAISRPFFNIGRNTESVLSVASPRIFRQTAPPLTVGGSSTATSPSRMRGAEANLVYHLRKARCCRINLMAGFRYLNLNEGLTIIDVTDTSDGNHFSDTDQFSTRNQFYGGQLGARFSFGQHRLNLELDGRVAIGGNHQSVEINGASSNNHFLPFNSIGGLLAVISNIGQYRRDKFTVVPEVKAQLAYKFTKYLRAFASYNFLYWNKVVRPGEQIDRMVNTLLVPNLSGVLISSPLRPAFTFNDTGFWGQGFNIGIQTRF